MIKETPNSVFTKVLFHFPNLTGILCVVGAMAAFTSQDAIVKSLSGGYPLHQIVLTRSVAALFLTLAIFIPFDGGYKGLRTRRLKFHLIRGFAIVIANLSFFTSIATLPLAQATTIFFVAPLIITILSGVILGDPIGIKRWMAVIIGLVGVLVILRPGTEVFQLASLLPLVAALAYALVQISTRIIGTTENASTMSFYIQLTVLVVSGIIGLAFGDGRYANTGDPTLEFLFRAWTLPPIDDLFLMTGVGFLNGIAGYLVMQGYRISEPARVAPFEYISVVFAILWGIYLFQEHLDFQTWLGIFVIVGAGIYTVYHEITSGREKVAGNRV